MNNYIFRNKKGKSKQEEKNRKTILQEPAKTAEQCGEYYSGNLELESFPKSQ